MSEIEKILPVSMDIYHEIFQKCIPHFQELKKIVIETKEVPEGDIVYKNKSFIFHSFNWPMQTNLITLAKQCQQILEIGFNMGHSTLLMLLANPNCRIDCIDDCSHIYTEKCFSYLSNAFPNRIRLYKGHSHKILSSYFEPFVDMLHIDGGRDFNTVNIDYFIGKNKVKKGGIIVYANTWLQHIKHLWYGYLRDKHIKEIEILPTHIPGFEQGHNIGRLLHDPPKIAVATIAIGEQYKNIIKYGHIGKMHYCRIHNYDLRNDSTCIDANRPFAWSKVPLILKCLSESYEYIVWLDADTHIMNFDKKLEEFISKFSNGKDILLTSDPNMINSGVMFIKNTEWSKKFFETLYKQTDFLNHPNWEQGAIIHMYDTNMLNTKNHMTVLPPYLQTEFNSYYSMFKKGQFLIHLAGNAQDSGAHLNDGRLKNMMDRYCPIKMENETEWDYTCRMQFINNL